MLISAAIKTGDMIIADEEGIVVIPYDDIENTYLKASSKAEKDTSMSLSQWQIEHRAKITALISEKKIN